MRLGGGKGFGLLEVILVVVLIVIVAAILFPSIPSAKEAAKRYTLDAPPSWGTFRWTVGATVMPARVRRVMRATIEPSLEAAGGDSAKVITSEKMKVTLVCADDKDAFEIVSVGGSDDQILEDGMAAWAWDVIPLKGGPHTLRITALRYIPSDLGPATKTEVSKEVSSASRWRLRVGGRGWSTGFQMKLGPYCLRCWLQHLSSASRPGSSGNGLGNG